MAIPRAVAYTLPAIEGVEILPSPSTAMSSSNEKAIAAVAAPLPLRIK